MRYAFLSANVASPVETVVPTSKSRKNSKGLGVFWGQNIPQTKDKSARLNSPFACQPSNLLWLAALERYVHSSSICLGWETGDVKKDTGRELQEKTCGILQLFPSPGFCLWQAYHSPPLWSSQTSNKTEQRHRTASKPERENERLTHSIFHPGRVLLDKQPL